MSLLVLRTTLANDNDVWFQRALGNARFGVQCTLEILPSSVARRDGPRYFDARPSGGAKRNVKKRLWIYHLAELNTVGFHA